MVKYMFATGGAFLAFVVLLISMIGLSGCDDVRREHLRETRRGVSDIQAYDQQVTADVYKDLVKAVPAPHPTDSVERRNLSKRLERFNVPSKISYIYLINYGKIMGYFVVKGKVSSVSSAMTCTQQLVEDGGAINQYSQVHVVESPQLDGSYGTNGEGIFFFTDTDTYVEWKGDYMLCDSPLKLAQPPELVQQVPAK